MRACASLLPCTQNKTPRASGIRRGAGTRRLTICTVCALGRCRPQREPTVLRWPCTINASAKAPHRAVQPYVIGTNATIFAPHSGLRISARDLAKLMQLLLNGGRYGDRQLLAPATVDSMLHEAWHFDAQRWNGDPFHGRYRAWGLGLQHIIGATDDLGGDRLAAGSKEQFWGHRGEAYGLLGGMWFDPQREVGFVFLAGGIGDDPSAHRGAYSSASSWEELLQTAIIGELDRLTN